MTADDVAVEGYFGVLDNQGVIRGGELVSLAASQSLGDGRHRFSGELECRFCGRYGFMVRVMPKHKELGLIYEPGYLLWG